ncbi:MAG: lactate utilization protein [Planctomycetaceae bacterium]|jgi:L-lactate dehydrogenase complex protein LldF|nr:lactate utilization protein [Planctomycetaceae bacterium]
MSGAEFLKEETRNLSEANGPKSLLPTSLRSTETALNCCWAIDQWTHWRQQAHDIKQYTLAHLDELLDQFTANLERKGFKVLWAADAEEANQLVLDIAKKHNAKTAVKAKSMVSEEIGLNHFLADRGITALETDLGEYIVQLAGQRPTHIVTPALHLSKEEIGKLFADKLGVKETSVPEELTALARKILRQKFCEADLGFSGVNFGIAETGTLCLVENEGNIGLSTSAPKVHIAFMGIEKLLPRLADLPLFLNMLPRMGTGQKLTTYTHLFNGPAPGREMYVILVDNGRTKALADPEFRQILQCIRCGLCMNHCPVYRQVGGWAYGWVYPGPLGEVLVPSLLGIEKTWKLPFACSLCGACTSICTVKIDLAHCIVKLRKRAVKAGTPAGNLLQTLIWKNYAFWMQSNRRFRLTMFGVKTGIRLAPFLPWHPNMLGAWTRGRALPQVPKEGSFRDWWKKKN